MAEARPSFIPNAGNRERMDMHRQELDDSRNSRQDANSRSGENFNEDNVDPFEDLWQTPKKNAEENGKVPDVTGNNVQQKSPQEAWKEHVDSIGFGNINLEDIRNDFMEGKTESLSEAFKEHGENVYKQAILTMQSLVDKRVSAAVEEAVTKAVGKTNANSALAKMHEALPFTQKPEMAPIAQAILQQFISKGKNTEESINMTKEFFKHVQKTSRGDLGLPPETSDGSGYSGRNSDDEPDWLALLGQN